MTFLCLNDLYFSLVVEHNEMAYPSVVPDICICLVGSGIAICPTVLLRLPPETKDVYEYPPDVSSQFSGAA